VGWLSRRRAELLLLAVALLAGLGLVELGGRLHVSRQLRLPFFHDGEQRFYPVLYRGLRGYDPHAHSVLLLGGSVLQYIPMHTWATYLPGRKVYSVAFKGHTSLDSRYKYEYLLRQGYHFDHVVFYHGINEVRTNNVPPELFAADYTHYTFYRMARRLFRDRSSLRSWLARHTYLGFSLELLALRAGTQPGELLPPDLPPRKWRRFGAEIKSARSYRANLVRIGELAREAGSVLLVPRFAYHHPEDYSFDRWQARRLGYQCDQRGSATHIWGDPKNVVAGIEAHNRAIDQEAGRYVLVDTSGITGRVEYFCDICHFSGRGVEAFVRTVAAALQAHEVRSDAPRESPAQSSSE
jgi:hypothetical protein